MKLLSYICSAKRLNRGDIHTNNAAIYSASSCVQRFPLGCLATIQRGVRSLFVHTRKTCYTMPNTNKQAAKVKYSSLQRIWKGQARLFGSITITRTFDNFNDACAWYDKYQEGWRYNNAVAVLWQGVTRRTPKRFLHDAMLGGKEWELVKERGITTQAQCDYLLNSKDFEVGYGTAY